MDSRKFNKDNTRRPDQDLSATEDVSRTICSSKGHGSDGGSGCGLCNQGDAGRDEKAVSQDTESDPTKSRRNKLKPIETKTFYDKYGIYYSSNNLWQVWKFIPNKRYGDTRLETAYIRIVRIQNLLHKLFESSMAMADAQAIELIRHQQAVSIEVLRILKQEILIERGWDRKELQQQETERIWDQKIW